VKGESKKHPGGRGSPRGEWRAARGARARVWQLLEPAREGDRPSHTVDLLVLTLILLNVVAVIMESMPALEEFQPAFALFNVASVLVFTAEYLARVWSCTADPRYNGPIRGRLRYMRTPLALVDLLAVAPFYIPVTNTDLRSLRILRLFFRLARALKLARYDRSLRFLLEVYRAKRADLTVVIGGLLTLLLIASSLMYFAENRAQPEVFSSIPAAMWWALVTLTTVGYGDIVPVTALGKLVASFVAVLGVGMFALPAGILASGFTERKKILEEGRRCPHCGGHLPGPE
jgi:voltage-gated potassium channel